jgi:hypothetical protein
MHELKRACADAANEAYGRLSVFGASASAKPIRALAPRLGSSGLEICQSQSATPRIAFEGSLRARRGSRRVRHQCTSLGRADRLGCI